MISVANASGGGGLPQFDASTFSSQGFWTIVSFVILLTLLKKYVIPAVDNVLDARSEKISNDIAEAERMRAEAKAMMEENKKNLSMAREESERIRQEVMKETTEHRQKALEELAEETSRLKANAQREIEHTKQKSLDEIRAAAVEISMLATEKLISKSVSQADADQMVIEAMQELKEKGLPIQ